MCIIISWQILPQWLLSFSAEPLLPPAEHAQLPLVPIPHTRISKGSKKQDGHKEDSNIKTRFDNRNTVLETQSVQPFVFGHKEEESEQSQAKEEERERVFQPALPMQKKGRERAT